LVRHGGHAQAAGFTIRNENLESFVFRIREIAARQLGGKELFPAIEVDAEIDLDSVDWALYESLAQLEPSGQGNPPPVFLSRDVEVLEHRVVGQGGSHMQLRLVRPNGGIVRPLPAVAFRQAAWAPVLPQFVDIVYTIGLNEWNGRRSLQLVIQDMQPASN
jgi:single-stranded-DNA-specific exonuclease